MMEKAIKILSSLIIQVSRNFTSRFDIVRAFIFRAGIDAILTAPSAVQNEVIGASLAAISTIQDQVIATRDDSLSVVGISGNLANCTSRSFVS